MGVRDHHPGPQLGSVRERNADGAATLDEDSSNRSGGTDVCPVLPGVGGDRLRDGAGPAADKCPLRHLAVDLADVVMQEDVGGPGGIRPAVSADRSRDAAGGLDLR